MRVQNANSVRIQWEAPRCMDCMYSRWLLGNQVCAVSKRFCGLERDDIDGCGPRAVRFVERVAA